MIHYHGLPISPATAAVCALQAGHAFVNYAAPVQLPLVIEVCSSFAIDNGAYIMWRAGRKVTDWSGFYKWSGECMKLPSCDFAVIPDSIDGGEEENDALVREWPHPKWFGAPVWHMHESLDRLERLAADWHRVCFGSSGEFTVVGNEAWWGRINQAMSVVCDADGAPMVRIHGLRMLSTKVFPKLPFSSADSTNIARSVGIDRKWGGRYTPPTKEARAAVLRSRIEAHNGSHRWNNKEAAH